jgi:hypothetical protein
MGSPQGTTSSKDPTAMKVVTFVVPSEVEESLDISDHFAVGSIQRCLDFARHDNLVGAIDLNRPLVFGESSLAS